MPIPLAALAAGQALFGIGQAALSGTGEAKAGLEEKLQNRPQYTGGGSILDYYKQAYQKASVLPTELASYKTQMQKIGESTAQGLGALAGRRSALAGVGSLIRGQQQAQQQAVTAGEAEQARRFGQLGGAAQMKTAEETKRYNLNVLAPYERQLQAATQKLQAAQARKDAGIQNIIGAGSLAAMGSLYGNDATKIGKTIVPPAGTTTGKLYSPYASPEFKEFQETVMPTSLTGRIPGYKAYKNTYFKNLNG